MPFNLIETNFVTVRIYFKKQNFNYWKILVQQAPSFPNNK